MWAHTPASAPLLELTVWPRPRRAAQRNPAGPSELLQQQIEDQRGGETAKEGQAIGPSPAQYKPPRSPSVEDQGTGETASI